MKPSNLSPATAEGPLLNTACTAEGLSLTPEPQELHHVDYAGITLPEDESKQPPAEYWEALERLVETNDPLLIPNATPILDQPEIRVSFIDRRGDSTRHSYPFPMTEHELDDFWRKEWTLTKSTPAYILNPKPRKEMNNETRTNRQRNVVQ